MSGPVYVLTVDQRGSRRGQDRVEQLINEQRTVPVLRGFERTAGDEVQAVLDDPIGVTDTVLSLLRGGHWSIGVGLGPVERPLPTSTRAGRGAAFQHARVAVERAKHSATHLAVAGDDGTAGDVQAVLDLLALLVARRSAPGWAAVDLVATGASQAVAAETLGVSKQAVSQRLRTAGWAQEQAGRATAARLLAQAGAGQS